MHGGVDALPVMLPRFAYPLRHPIQMGVLLGAPQHLVVMDGLLDLPSQMILGWLVPRLFAQILIYPANAS